MAQAEGLLGLHVEINNFIQNIERRRNIGGKEKRERWEGKMGLWNSY